ncbi:hypothetical protein ACN47E_001301 [Coniothyrium glycines]
MPRPPPEDPAQAARDDSFRLPAGAWELSPDPVPACQPNYDQVCNVINDHPRLDALDSLPMTSCAPLLWTWCLHVFPTRHVSPTRSAIAPGTRKLLVHAVDSPPTDLRSTLRRQTARILREREHPWAAG